MVLNRDELYRSWRRTVYDEKFILLEKEYGIVQHEKDRGTKTSVKERLTQWEKEEDCIALIKFLISQREGLFIG